jgi:hypothetical protein
MSHAVQTALPAAVLDVYRAPELVVLALSGLAIAVAGALAPAGWAARARTASALRAEWRSSAWPVKKFSRPVSISGLPVRSTNDGGRNGRPPEHLKEMQCGRSSPD